MRRYLDAVNNESTAVRHLHNSTCLLIIRGGALLRCSGGCLPRDFKHIINRGRSTGLYIENRCLRQVSFLDCCRCVRTICVICVNLLTRDAGTKPGSHRQRTAFNRDCAGKVFRGTIDGHRTAARHIELLAVTHRSDGVEACRLSSTCFTDREERTLINVQRQR